MPCVHPGAASDRPVTTKTAQLPPIPEVVWQQPTETSLNQYNLHIINNHPTIQTAQDTQQLTDAHVFNAASQTSPHKGIQPQNHIIATEQPPGIKQGKNQHRSIYAP